MRFITFINVLFSKTTKNIVAKSEKQLSLKKHLSNMKQTYLKRRRGLRISSENPEGQSLNLKKL